MAAGDFWRRLSRDLLPAEISAGLYINPLLFESAIYDITTGSGITLAQARVLFNLPVGTDAGTEFEDLATSANSLPGTGSVKRALQQRVLQGITAAAIVAGRGARLPGNPYPDGNSLRLRAKALISLEGGTPSGSLGAA